MFRLMVEEFVAWRREVNTLVYKHLPLPKKTDKMFLIQEDILKSICALRNCGGGELTIWFAGTCSMSEAKYCADRIKKDVKKRLSDTENDDLLEWCSSRGIMFLIKGSKELVTMTYNMYLMVNGEPEPLPSTKSAAEVRSLLQDRNEQPILELEIGSLDQVELVLDQIVKKPLPHGPKTVKFEDVHEIPAAWKLRRSVSALANHRGGEVYYGITDQGKVQGVKIEETDLESVRKTLKNDIESCLTCPKHGYKINEFEEITFLPVKFADPKGKVQDVPDPNLYVIKLKVNAYQGLIFTEEPESYQIVENRVERLPFSKWMECLKASTIEILHTRGFVEFEENSQAFKRLFLPDEYETLLKGLEWVESFKIVDANEECSAPHLEVVCKFGEVPRTADIVKYFSEDILPFIAYKKNSKHEWFDTNIIEAGSFDMKEKYKEKLGRLEWVESFKIVDANEECSERHLEIVCTFGKLPRTADIVQLFGEEIFPFITYQECSRREWFETNILRENSDELRSLEWVEDYEIVDANEECNERHLEIVCKFDKVPRIADIVKLFDKKILPFITYKKGSQHNWFETNVLDEHFDVKEIFKEKLARLEWVHSFKIVDANEECCERHLEIVCKLGKVPRTAEIVQLFGEEILPLIIYQECSKLEWFKTNMLGRKTNVRNSGGKRLNCKSELESLPWVKDYYFGIVNEPEKSWQLFITCNQNKVPPMPMVELKKLLGVDIASFVDFVQDKNPNAKFPATPSHLRGPRSGDKLSNEVEDNGIPGTIGILGVDKKHYATTCYHVCYSKDLPKDSKLAHEILKNDCANENSQDCKGATYVFKWTDEEERILGQFREGLYDDDHDIALIELDSNLNCSDAVKFLRQERIETELADIEQVEDIFFEMNGLVPVQKIGSVTGITNGELFSLNGGRLFPSTDAVPYYRIKGKDGQDFANRGDSGSLVYAIFNGKRIPFGYVSMVIPELKIYGCRNLLHSIKKLSRDIQPCLEEHH